MEPITILRPNGTKVTIHIEEAPTQLSTQIPNRDYLAKLFKWHMGLDSWELNPDLYFRSTDGKVFISGQKMEKAIYHSD
jgi:hypothetical protein